VVFTGNGKSVRMHRRLFVEGEVMDDTERYARLATHLNSKKAGPLVCPICNATESFEAKGTLSGPPSDPLAPPDLPAPAEPRFNYAACTNCGYSIFFDAETSNLLE
jgi:hypothetical protein